MNTAHLNTRAVYRPIYRNFSHMYHDFVIGVYGRSTVLFCLFFVYVLLLLLLLVQMKRLK